jgi:hypothetical protein
MRPHDYMIEIIRFAIALAVALIGIGIYIIVTF